MENWNKIEILSVMRRPLLNLVFDAASVHRKHHDPRFVQMSSLISIKTGGCPEDCSYCPQSARYATGIKKHALMSVDEVVDIARNAKANGSSRVCMGAAWREVRDNPEFDRVLQMVRAVANLDVEVCCTLGMLSESQAKKLEAAGLYAYNHNIDTSSEKYSSIITTRRYQDRLQTLENVRKANLSVCSGGIIGMGESENDRADFLCTLANLNPPPESVPINTLVPVSGTPLGDQPKIDSWELVRMVATARIVLPKSMIRLSAGRNELSGAEQALCFLAGANSIFAGEKLLTTPNPAFDADNELFATLGLNHERNL